jgi:tRNA G18 (ribose-2'-O)-methylase SpoU
VNRGYCGIGIVHGKTEVNIGTLLRSAHGFGADFVFTVGRRYEKQSSDTTQAWRHVPLLHFTDLDDLRAHLPYSCPLIGVEQAPGAFPLERFVHPERAIYLLGAEDHGLIGKDLAACHQLVEISGAKWCLNVAVAGSIVLHDRVMKRARKTDGQSFEEGNA